MNEITMSDQSENTYKIGVWGTSRTGKTTFISMLYHTFAAQHRLNAISKGQSTENSTPPVWTINAVDKASQDFAKHGYERIFGNKLFPEKTCTPATYRYDIKKIENATESHILLEILDAPGEIFEALYDETRWSQPVDIPECNYGTDESPPIPREAFNYLKSCDGLLVMLDPSWQPKPAEGRPVPRDYSQLLWDMFRNLREARRNLNGHKPQRLALVTTKVDATLQMWQNRNKLRDARMKCYMDPRYFIQGSTCARDCPVYQLLGERFMRHDLPHLFQPEEQMNDYVACFNIASIGRFAEDEGSNFGSNQDWPYPVTPIPGRFTTINETIWETENPLHYLTEALDDVKVAHESFRPSSINNRDQINPYGLIEPVDWLINAFENRH